MSTAKSTFLEYYGVQRSALLVDTRMFLDELEQIARKERVIDEARRLCAAIAELALEARSSRDPRVTKLALRLLTLRLRRVSELSETIEAVA